MTLVKYFLSYCHGRANVVCIIMIHVYSLLKTEKALYQNLTAMKTFTSHLLKLNICYITCSSEEPRHNWIKYLAFCHMIRTNVLDKLSLMFLEPNPLSSGLSKI